MRRSLSKHSSTAVAKATGGRTKLTCIVHEEKTQIAFTSVLSHLFSGSVGSCASSRTAADGQRVRHSRGVVCALATARYSFSSVSHLKNTMPDTQQPHGLLHEPRVRLSPRVSISGQARRKQQPVLVHQAGVDLRLNLHDHPHVLHRGPHFFHLFVLGVLHISDDTTDGRKRSRRYMYKTRIVSLSALLFSSSFWCGSRRLYVHAREDEDEGKLEDRWEVRRDAALSTGRNG